MDNLDIRWEQRLHNYVKALALLEEAILLSSQRELSDLEEEGLIKRFELTHELAWNLMKDYLIFQGITSIIGLRDAVREAFSSGLITNGFSWMEMIRSRSISLHTYNEEIVLELQNKIVKQYFPLFVTLKETMNELGSKT
ncbi:MAG: hypothetical protein AMXMBFR48_27060 [Ignavibacteriales bacterium]